ncbi:MAG: hypothetical protein HY077_03005 [Elusimicrobia bacterium]|nr:hypothetical protein [Elusimicrobiota bacterium]
MKRLTAIVVAFAVIELSGGPAAAELLKNFRLSGQIDVQATAAHNIVDFSTHGNPDATYPPGCGAAPLPACAPNNNDRVGDAQTRVMVHMDWDMLDDVHAKITLTKNDRSYGTAGNGAAGQAQVSANSQPIGPAGPNILGTVYVDQAYFKVDKIAGQVDLTLGRQFYGDAGDIVIYYGPSEKAWYGLPTNAIDVARTDWGLEWLSVTGLVGKQTGSLIGTAPQPDVDVRGVNMMAKSGDELKGSLFLWNKLTHNTGASGAPPTSGGAAASSAGGKNDSLFVIGAKFKASGGGFWLKGEFDQNFGDNRGAVANIAGAADPRFAAASHYMGWATMGNGGYKAESDGLGTASVWGEVSAGSGRQSTRDSHNAGWTPINSDYRPGSIYGRFQAIPGILAGGAAGTVLVNGGPGFGSGLGSGVVGIGGNANATPANDTGFLSNRVIWGGGIKLSPAQANKFQMALSYWDFRIHRFNNVPQKGNSFNGNKHIGSEFDVDFTWTHSDNVAFAAGWGTFQPGGLIYEAVRIAEKLNTNAPAASRQGVNPALLAYFDTRIKF